MGELHANAMFLTEYRDANLLCFSGMWREYTIDSQHLHVDGFGALIRTDRTEASMVQRGGGLCCFINEHWWNNHTVKRIICTPDIELLSISCPSVYLARVRRIIVPITATAMLFYNIYLLIISSLYLAVLFQYLIYFTAAVYIFIYLILMYTCITM